MKKIMAVMAVMAVMALAAAAVPVIAGEPEYSGDKVPFGTDKSMEAAAWPASGPVETGAVPGLSEKEGKFSPTDTHFNPFYPERRVIDQDGGGE